MDTALKVLIGLICVPLFIGGAKIMFDPTSMLEKLFVSADGAAGLNSVRGAIGGLLMGCSVMGIIGLVRGDTTWFLAVAAMMAVVTFGRVVGIAVDGMDPNSLRGAVVEAVIVLVMVGAHFRLSITA